MRFFFPLRLRYVAKTLLVLGDDACVFCTSNASSFVLVKQVNWCLAPEESCEDALGSRWRRFATSRRSFTKHALQVCGCSLHSVATIHRMHIHQCDGPHNTSFRRSCPTRLPPSARMRVGFATKSQDSDEVAMYGGVAFWVSAVVAPFHCSLCSLKSQQHVTQSSNFQDYQALR